MRLIDADALKEEFLSKTHLTLFELLDLIDNAPTVELFCSYLSDGEVREPCVEAPCKHERPQSEWLEINHRLNLLIGVLYSNQCISESDVKYIEDSIKKLMEGSAE